VIKLKNNITLIVFLKELKDMFRDKKTILIGVLIPIIIFPLMFFVIGKSMQTNNNKVENNLKISLVDNSNSSFGSYLRKQKNLKIVDSKNPDQDLKDGKIFLSIEIPDNFDDNITKEISASINLEYDNSSQQSSTAEGIVSSYLDSFSKEIVTNRLSKRSIDTSLLTPTVLKLKTVEKVDNGIGKMLLSIMLPLLLIVYSVSGPLPAATDLGAGEKERGTLEPLLTTQAGRMSLLWGKFLAITTLGLISTIASMIGMYIAITQKGGLFSSTTGGAGFSIGGTTIIMIGIVTILFTMAFGALELAISIFARSFKEAQTYLSPLIIIAIIPAYGTYMLDAKNIDAFYFSIPIANGVCLIKEFISGIYNYYHMAITFGWLLAYIVISIMLATYMFNREEVIFRT